MADNYIIKKKTLTDIADAVRAKKGITVSSGNSGTAENVFYSFDETAGRRVTLEPSSGYDYLASVTINPKWQTSTTNILHTYHPTENNTQITGLVLDFPMLPESEIQSIEIDSYGTGSTAIPLSHRWVMTYIGPCFAEAEEWLYNNFSATESFAGESIDYLIKLSCATGELRDFVYTAYFVHFANIGNYNTFYLAGITDNFGMANSLTYDELHSGAYLYPGDDFVTIKWSPNTQTNFKIYYNPVTGFIRGNNIRPSMSGFESDGIYELCQFQSSDEWNLDELGFTVESGVYVDDNNNVVEGDLNYITYSTTVDNLTGLGVSSSDGAILAPYACKAVIGYRDANNNMVIVWSQKLSDRDGYTINLPQYFDYDYVGCVFGITWPATFPEGVEWAPFVQMGQWTQIDSNDKVSFGIGSKEEIGEGLYSYIVRASGYDRYDGSTVYRWSSSNIMFDNRVVED